jgi:putative SbcD/Mre11-related phosphoesterase
MKETIKFVTGEAALTVGKALVVSDLHIGIEYKFRKEGIALPSQLERITKRIEALLDRSDAKRLVIIGDVKHKVPGTSYQEEREIPAFFRHFLKRVAVEFVPGNHDGGIEALLPEDVRVYPAGGFMLGRTWLCHGHAWPGEEFLKARKVVIGHNHAGIEFRDGLGYRWTEPVWLRARFERKKLGEKFPSARKDVRLPELVLMPVFNEFSGYIPLNMKMRGKFGRSGFPSPLFRAANRDSARVYMLDGTYLGELGKL